MSEISRDALQRFSFDNTDLRGEIAHLDDSWREVIRRHQYPQIVRRSLGELMAATALLSSNLKFAGRLTLQARLPGNVSLLQAETSDQGQLRAIARYDHDSSEADLSFADGHLVITIEPEQGQKYQGITAISGGNIAAALEEYFTQSEQLATRFWLACGNNSAAGLMVQKMPAAANDDEDAWDRISHLASTVKDEELLQLPAEELLHRLFHEEQTRVYPASALSFFCTCSKDRTATALHQLGYDELQSMLHELGQIDITCEFCQQHYVFDEQDINELFPERNLH